MKPHTSGTLIRKEGVFEELKSEIEKSPEKEVLRKEEHVEGMRKEIHICILQVRNYKAKVSLRGGCLLLYPLHITRLEICEKISERIFSKEKL